jgi:hypothetical protein
MSCKAERAECSDAIAVAAVRPRCAATALTIMRPCMLSRRTRPLALPPDNRSQPVGAPPEPVAKSNASGVRPSVEGLSRRAGPGPLGGRSRAEPDSRKPLIELEGRCPRQAEPEALTRALLLHGGEREVPEGGESAHGAVDVSGAQQDGVLPDPRDDVCLARDPPVDLGVGARSRGGVSERIGAV